MVSRFRSLFLLLALAAASAGTGCHTTAGKVAGTPVTVIRDVVDAPLVSLTNVFEHWASKTEDDVPAPTAGVSFGEGGVHPNVGVRLGFIWKPFSWVFGGVDYVICRSLYPNWPRGISPWRAEGESWGTLYFPNTRYLWRDREAETIPEERTDLDIE